MIITDFFGPPIVPTPKKIIKEIFNEINPKKGDLLIDLGSGNGRVLLTGVREYGVRGLGIEINPFLVLWSRLSALLIGQKDLEFKRQNYFKTDLSKAEIIFMYLLPKYILKVAKKIEKECRKNTVVVSQRFSVEGWEKFLIKEMPRKSNSTYIYRLKA